LSRLLDESYDRAVRDNLVPLTATRIVANTAYRFAPPFIAIIAGAEQGFDVSIARVGLVISISELAGFLAPLLGTFVDRVSRRTAMAVGLAGSLVGILLMAIAPNLVVLCVGLTLLNLLKSCFDLGMAAWIADRVPYDRRGRVVGLTETSWALSLLVGVSLLGLVTAVSTWRVACVIGAVAIAACATWLDSSLRRSGDTVNGGTAATGVATSGDASPVGTPTSGARAARAWLVPLSMFGLMGASQCLFVTFGAWLADDFDFGASRIAAVGFALGAGELLSSVSSARYTDRIGKERSVALGALLMIPAAIVLAGFDSLLAVGLMGLATFIVGFEYAVVSMLPIATSLFAGAPGKGFGLVIGAGTFGRGVLTFVATSLYESGGIAGAALAGAVCAALSAVAIEAFSRVQPR
jgi:predicted MFS family arabinose efflux permease